MADLEELGFIASPHTSAGRMPDARAATASSSTRCSSSSRSTRASCSSSRASCIPDNPQRVMQSASQLLSQLTQFAGVVMTPRRRAVTFRHIEFLRLSEKRVLLIVVTPDGDVQNRILFTERDYTPSRADRGGELHQPELRRA